MVNIISSFGAPRYEVQMESKTWGAAQRKLSLVHSFSRPLESILWTPVTLWYCAALRGRTRGLNCSDNSAQALIPWYIGGSRLPNSIKIITEKTHREIVFQNTCLPPFKKKKTISQETQRNPLSATGIALAKDHLISSSIETRISLEVKSYSTGPRGRAHVVSSQSVTFSRDPADKPGTQSISKCEPLHNLFSGGGNHWNNSFDY